MGLSGLKAFLQDSELIRIPCNGSEQHIDYPVAPETDPDTGSCVLMISGEGRGAVFEGFTVTGGTGTLWNNTRESRLYREGGGILIDSASPVIRNNRIIANEVTDDTDAVSAGGGGLRCCDGCPLIEKNTIRDNRGRYGAGLALWFSPAVIRRNIIVENIGGEYDGGSGVWSYGVDEIVDPASIESCTIAGNVSSPPSGSQGPHAGRGGGLVIWGTSIRINNSIIWNNIQHGGGQMHLCGATAEITYSVFQGGFDALKSSLEV